MKLTKITCALAILVLASASVARADSLPDPRQGVGTSGPGSPPCSQFSYAANAGGAIPAGTQCTEGANTTTLSVFAPGSNPLSVYSPLLSTPTIDSGNPVGNAIADALFATTDLKWSLSCGAITLGSGTAQECTLTAPTVDSATDKFVLAAVGAMGLLNDGDCDSDDTVLFIPKGCDVFFTTGAIGGLPGDSPSQLFSPNETLESTSNGAPPIPFVVPEPASLALMFVGFGGFAALRRKLTN